MKFVAPVIHSFIFTGGVEQRRRCRSARKELLRREVGDADPVRAQGEAGGGAGQEDTHRATDGHGAQTWQGVRLRYPSAAVHALWFIWDRL